MHELPITENLLELALRSASDAGGGRITDLHLVIGPLSGVVDESVRFYWEILTEGTVAEGSRLHFRRTVLEMECRACGIRFRPESEDYHCTACGSPQVKTVGGTEFHLDAIDLESAEPPPAG
jgi:hydrogenase nickel incorporation protein HypA/HybF